MSPETEAVHDSSALVPFPRSGSSSRTPPNSGPQTTPILTFTPPLERAARPFCRHRVRKTEIDREGEKMSVGAGGEGDGTKADMG